jgi:hypothetical protein
MPQDPAKPPDGSEDKYPLILEGVDSLTFKAFVNIAAASE